MSTKIVIMNDFTVRESNAFHMFDKLKDNYDVDLKYITVQKYIKSGEEFSEMFLNMEKNGPDVIEEEGELLYNKGSCGEEYWNVYRGTASRRLLYPSYG